MYGESGRGSRAALRRLSAPRLWRQAEAGACAGTPPGEAAFEVAGDELYVDAHILKWHPLANLIGLHTGYELDRVAGRYTSLEDERSKPRTVFPLAHPKPVNLFDLAQHYPFLATLVDAEYGSATFLPAQQPAQLELQVSTTGLLLRKVGDGRK
jgi:hypothetical protein